VRAKPAIPVAGEPLVRRIIQWLAAAGVVDLVLNLHHLPATLTGILGDGGDLGVRVRYSWEQPRVLGSAGGPRQALDVIGAPSFLIVNGDTLADVNLAALAEAHRASGALVTLALAPNLDPDRYGGVQLDPGGRVTGFVPRGSAAAGSFHFVGVQAVEAEAFHSVKPGDAVNSIGEVYDALMAARPGSVRGVVSETSFWDVGTIADYWRTSHALMNGSAVDREWQGRGVHIDRSARVTQSILWDDVEVGANAVLHECIVADGVNVPPGAQHHQSVLVRADGAMTVTPFDPDLRPRT
jgi:mannose-1-phosphate guanylyltransferase